MTSEAAEPSRADDQDRAASAGWRTLARFESLLPPLLFVLTYSVIVPWWRPYQIGFDEGLNLMKGALVAKGFPLYSEIWSDQPPLLTRILAATQQAFPFDVGAARAVVLAFSGLLIWSLFSARRRLEGRACAWLKGLDAARDWLQRSAIRPGVWSRLYEIGTNRPIYVDRDGKIRYSLDDISEERRTGYRWEAAFPSVIRALGRYQALSAGGLDGLQLHEQEAERERRRRLHAEAVPQVAEIMSRVVLGKGWVEGRVLSTQTFVSNCNILLNAVEFAENEAGQR
jgi:Pectic acid lyase